MIMVCGVGSKQCNVFYQYLFVMIALSENLFDEAHVKGYEAVFENEMRRGSPETF